MEKEISFEDLSVGSEMPMLVKAPVDNVQLVKYSGASGDFNPLHTDSEFGKAVGIGQIAHGMLVMGFVGQAITDWIPKKFLKKLSVRFTGMTRPGDVITVTGKLREKRSEGGSKNIVCDVFAKNQKGEAVVAGFFEAVLP
jgi:acyl dehydratase